MISTYQLKRGFQNLIRPIAHWLLKQKITPNQVTLFTLLLSLLVSLVLWLNFSQIQLFFFMPLFLFVRMALNAIDGVMAKEGHLTSALGVFLNELGDVIADVALFVVFIRVEGIPLQPLVFLIFFAVISELAGVVAVQTGAPRRYEGPMGKSDRAVLMGVISLCVAFGVTSPLIYNTLLYIGNIALVVTIFSRIKNGILESKKA